MATTKTEILCFGMLLFDWRENERKKRKQNTHTKQNKNQQLQQEQQHGLLMKTHKVAFHITCWICATCIWRLIGFVMYTFKQTFNPAIISDANSHNHAICQIIGKLANLWNWFSFQLWITLYKRRNRHPSPPKTKTTTKKRRNLDWHASPPPPPHTHTHTPSSCFKRRRRKQTTFSF